MDDKIQTRSNPAIAIVKALVLTAAMVVLSSCEHHPHKNEAMGEQFLGKRTVKTVYQDDHGNDKHRQNTPINAGDEFEIVRKSRYSNEFEFVPGDNFRGDPAWAGLTLNYNAGIDTNEPVPLIAEVCAKGQSSGDEQSVQQEAQYDYISANVQNDFLNLSGRGLEFLESEPVLLGGKPHIIHVFHIKKIGAKEVSLVIFYCDKNACNHRGMIDA